MYGLRFLTLNLGVGLSCPASRSDINTYAYTNEHEFDDFREWAEAKARGSEFGLDSAGNIKQSLALGRLAFRHTPIIDFANLLASVGGVTGEMNQLWYNVQWAGTKSNAAVRLATSTSRDG